MRWFALALLAAATGCAGPAPLQPPPGAAERAAATDWSRAEVITVTLDEYAFLPSAVALRVGQPVRLRFENTGARPHDWTSPAFFRTVTFRPGDPQAASVLAAGGSVDVPPGGAREVTLVPLSPVAGEVTCIKPLHATLGMTGRVVVSD
jgi:plastocyanin